MRFAMDLDRSYFSSLPFGIYRLTFSEGARDTAFTAYHTDIEAEPTTATYTFKPNPDSGVGIGRAGESGLGIVTARFYHVDIWGYP